MYRGIIQEGEFADEDSYLNQKIKSLGLEKNKGYGRIYRISHRDYKRDATKPQLLDKTSAELIYYLGHPNGWWRDMAQQLLILKRDDAVGNELEKIAIQAPDASIRHDTLAQIHALWTLEGMDMINRNTLFAALKSLSGAVRKARFG